MRLRVKKILAVLLPVQIILIKILGSYTEFIEQYYSNGLYPILSKLSRFIFGWIPFSIGDILYVFLILYALRWLYKNRNNIRLIPVQLGVSVLAFLSVLSFAFHVLWGMNYYRMPLHKTLHINNTYNTTQLIATTKKLIKKTNAIHAQINRNDSLAVSIPYSSAEILSKTQQGFTALVATVPQLAYNTPSVKKSLLSFPLTYMGFSGYLNPFTNEAQINYLPPAYHLPLTSSHEVGHQIGYAAENETNFIGYLAAKHNPDIYFKYAANTFAVRYCINELYRRDEELGKQLANSLHFGVRENFKENRTFWSTHQNPIEVVFKYGFDLFLKSKEQDKGIDSYSYVVALLVNYELNEPIQ